MAGFVGHRRREIVFVGSTPPSAHNFDGLVALPDALKDLPAAEVMARYEVRRARVSAKSVTASMARIALVSVYGVPCGISTYSSWLWPAMVSKVAEARVFAEIEAGAPDIPGVVRCWRHGEPLGGLVAALREYDPDAVFIQHEYGHFPLARHWLAFLSAISDLNPIVTLHSVYRHDDKIVTEAACAKIVVHTEAAARVLTEKGVAGRVTVIPHGAKPCTSRHRLWNTYGSDHTILQFGFGFPYKGWENSLRVTAALKTDYPDVFFTGLFSERWPGVHNGYHRELLELAASLGVADHVALIRGFQSDPCLEAFLRTNRVALFPYVDNGEHTVFGCSGAARLAMTAGLPVVASSVPLFDDLEGVVPRPATVEGWASAVAEAFEDPEAHLDTQDGFLAERSWGSVAERYLALL